MKNPFKAVKNASSLCNAGIVLDWAFSMKGRLSMTYTSLVFYLFILILLFFYYIMPLKSRWGVLLAGSIIFYFAAYKTGWWVILATVVFSYVAGIFLQMQVDVCCHSV